MATLRGNRVIQVEQTSNAVEHYQFIGIHITASPSIDAFDLVRLWAPGIHTRPEYTPNDIVFDRCIIRGHPLRTTGKGIRFCVRNGVVKNSVFDDFKGYNDTQAITNFNGPGPLTIHNNYLSATGENILSGGAIPDIPGLVPAGYVIEFNAIVKDPDQLLIEPWRPGMYVKAGKIVTWSRGRFKALDSGTTGTTAPVFPLTTVNTAPAYPLAPGFVRPLETGCTPGFCVVDNGVRWQLIDVAAAQWRPNSTMPQGELIYYKGTETQNQTVYYYASKGGVTGSAPPFRLPKLALNPSPSVCNSTYCINDGSVQWQAYSAPSTWWVNKNLVEFKAVDGAKVRWNLMSGSWRDGQSGWGFNLKAENQDPSNRWTARTENLEIAHNVVMNVERPLGGSGNGDYAPGIARNWNIHGNLVMQPRATSNSALMLYGKIDAVRLVHNTVEVSSGSSLMSLDGALKPDSLTMTDNLVQRGPYGVKRAGVAEGTPSLAATFTSYFVASNVISGIPLASYPSGNFATPWDQIGFENPQQGRYALQPGSPFRNAGTDGKDLGADYNQLPLIRNLRVDPLAQSALITYDLGPSNQAIPCALELSLRRDFTTVVDDVNPQMFSRPDSDRHNEHIVAGGSRMLRLGKNKALTPGATYWYRLHCGGDLRTGSFVMLSAAPSTTTLALPAFTPAAGAASVAVEYGYSYARTPSDSILSPVTSSRKSCAAGQACSLTIPVDPSKVVYYRFVTYSADSRVIARSGVAAAVIRQ